MKRLLFPILLVIVVVALQWRSGSSEQRAPEITREESPKIQNNEQPPAAAPQQTSPTLEGSRESQTAKTAPLLKHTIAYLKEHNALPDYYLTKKEAVSKGWVPSKSNLAEILPGMMIGGDIFTNAERRLPTAKGRVWREADFEYVRGSRNAKRIVYSNDGLIFISYDHYETFIQQ